HLAFATECWLHRAILGDPSPWAPLSLPWDQMPNTPGVPRDRAARPSLDESLAADTTPVDGPGWPPPRSFPVRECLLCILNEEWEHRLYAERDPQVLEARAPGSSDR